MNSIAKDSQFEPLSTDRWQLEFSDRWNVGNIPNGGYQMAAVARVLAEKMPHPHPLTVTGHYLNPTRIGPAEVSCELLKTGKRISTGLARVVQEGRQTLHITASYTDLTASKGPTVVELEPPPLLPPEQCIALNDVVQHEAGVHKNLECRLDPSCADWGQGGSAELRLWTRFADGSPPDLFSLLFFADAQPPPIFNRRGNTGWVPTVELTVHLYKPPAPGWLRGRFRSQVVQDGNLEEDGELWDSTGALVATSRQMGQIR